MATKLFINLPVKDLPKSIAFFTALGFSFDPRFTDETATCMVIGDSAYAMLLTEPKFRQFTPKSICDTATSTEVLMALTRDNRQSVDAFVDQALSGGGKSYGEPQDHGFMYQRSFQGLDGHNWEVLWMDESAFPTHPET